MRFRRYETDEELARAFPVMRELRTHLSLETYMELLEEMIAGGYQLWGVVDEHDEIQALAGIAFRTNFYYGRYAWVYDLVTRPDTRSKGYGAALLAHVEDLARDRGCDTVALASGVQRIDAHRFYETKMGYERPSWVFKKDLQP